MTTYEQGRAPDGAPVTWRRLEHDSHGEPHWFLETATEVIAKVSAPCDLDAICRAFHLAKLAEDYAKAKSAMDASATAADIESVRAAYYDAARALCEAVR